MMDNPILLELVMFGFVALIVFAFSYEAIKYKIDLWRIAAHVRRHGGTVINIEWNRFWGDFTAEKHGRHYSVSYKNREGHVVDAICRTSAFRGVEWVQEATKAAEAKATEHSLPHDDPGHKG